MGIKKKKKKVNYNYERCVAQEARGSPLCHPRNDYGLFVASGRPRNINENIAATVSRVGDLLSNLCPQLSGAD